LCWHDFSIHDCCIGYLLQQYTSCIEPPGVVRWAASMHCLTCSYCLYACDVCAVALGPRSSAASRRWTSLYLSVCTPYVVMIGLLYKAYPNGYQQVLLRLRPYPVRGHQLLCITHGSVCTSMCQLQVIGAFLLLRPHCSLQPLPPSLATPPSSHHNPPPHPSKQLPWPGQAQQP